MENVLTYFLQVNLLLVIVFLGYQFLLKNLTFYILNRVYFVIGSLYALLYPLLDVKSLLVDDAQVSVPILWDYVPMQVVAQITVRYSVYDVLLVGIAIGAVLFVLKFIVQLLSLVRIHFSSKKAQWHTYIFRDVIFPIVPFSFFNKIYLHKAQHQEIELNDILEHENVHVKGLHTWDVLFFEILLVACWYNPFLWFMRKAVRQNLEFLTDQQVLNRGVDRQTYQYSLLHVTQQGTAVAISNQFNFKTLKKRISMMNKKRSSRVELSKYAFLLPVMILAGASFTIGKAEDKIVEVVDLAKETALETILPKSTAVLNTLLSAEKEGIREGYLSPSKMDSLGYLLNGKLVDIAVVKLLNAKDLESVVYNVDNQLTKKHAKKSILSISTKSYAGTVGTPSQYSFISFDENDHLHLGGTLKIEEGNAISKVSVDKIEFSGNEVVQKGTNTFQQSNEFKKLKNRNEIEGDKSYLYEYDGKIISKKEFFAIPERELKELTVLNTSTIFKGKYAKHVPKDINYDGVIRAMSIAGEKSFQVRMNKVIFIIDGVEMAQKFDFSAVNPNDILGMTVLKDSMATTKYGEKAKDGVIILETKNGAKNGSKETITVSGFKKGDAPAITVIGGKDFDKVKNKDAVALLQGKVTGITINDNGDSNSKTLRVTNMSKPLFIVDGVEKGSDFEMKNLNTDDIESINVIKDASATTLYGGGAKNGVIMVTMKPTKNGTATDKPKIKLRGVSSFHGTEKPLVVLDGVTMKADFDLNSLASDDIESISVLKGANAIALYGESATKGVLIIITKKALKKDSAMRK